MDIINKIDEKLSDVLRYWIFEEQEYNFCYRLVEILRNPQNYYLDIDVDEEEINQFLDDFHSMIFNLGKLDRETESLFQLSIGNYNITIYYEDYDLSIYLKELLKDIYDYNSVEEHLKALFGDKAESYYEYYYIDDLIDLNFTSMGTIDDSKVFNKIIEVKNFFVVIE